MNRLLILGGVVLLILAVLLTARIGLPRTGGSEDASEPSFSASSARSGRDRTSKRRDHDSIEDFLAALDDALAHPELTSNDEWMRLRDTGFSLRSQLSLDEVLARIPIFEAWNDPDVPGMYWVAHCFYYRWGELDPGAAWDRTWRRGTTQPGVVYPSEPIGMVLTGWSEVNAKAAMAQYLIARRAIDDGHVDFRLSLPDPLMQNWAQQNPDEAMNAMIDGEAPADIRNYLPGLAKLDSMANHVDRLDQFLDRWAETREFESPEQHGRFRSYCEKAFAVVWAREDPTAALAWHASRSHASVADDDTEAVAFEDAVYIIDRLVNENRSRAEQWLREECRDERMIAEIAAKHVWDPPLFFELASRVSSSADRLVVAEAVVEAWNDMLPTVPASDTWSEPRVTQFVRESQLAQEHADRLVAQIQQPGKPSAGP